MAENEEVEDGAEEVEEVGDGAEELGGDDDLARLNQREACLK